MISRTYILQNLELLDRRFRNANSAKESLLYSKLAILELCGWIEESMDDVVMRSSVRQLRVAENRRYIEEQVVDRTYGFEYKKHFRKMLIQLLGMVNVERLESRVDSVKKAQLEATLGSLKTIRNTEAHTHIRGTTRTINAPSVTRSQFNLLYDGLKEYDSAIRSMGF